MSVDSSWLLYFCFGAYLSEVEFFASGFRTEGNIRLVHAFGTSAGLTIDCVDAAAKREYDRIEDIATHAYIVAAHSHIPVPWSATLTSWLDHEWLLVIVTLYL